MTDYSITLTKRGDVNIPKFPSNLTTKIDSQVQLALSAFDKDNKGLNEAELLDAFNYFVKKEKEVAAKGKKGDGIITSQDINEIIKTDSKFQAIRNDLKDDNKVVDLLSNIVMTLSLLVCKQEVYNPQTKETKDLPVYMIGQNTVEYIDEDLNMHITHKSNTLVTNTQSEIKNIKGKKVQVCWNNEGKTYVLTEDGKHRYIKPDDVAKYLGYTKESSWFGSDKYYDSTKEGRQYKVWDKKTHSFSNGKLKP